MVPARTSAKANDTALAFEGRSAGICHHAARSDAVLASDTVDKDVNLNFAAVAGHFVLHESSNASVGIQTPFHECPAITIDSFDSFVNAHRVPEGADAAFDGEVVQDLFRGEGRTDDGENRRSAIAKRLRAGKHEFLLNNKVVR